MNNEALDRLAAMAPIAEVVHNNQGYSKPLDVESWLINHGIDITSKGPYEGGTRYIIVCPFNPEHRGTSCALIQYSNGAIKFKCQHDECKNNDWAKLRELKDPGYKNRNNGHRTSTTIIKDESFTLTDVGNAKRLISQFGNSLRFCYERDKWLVFNGKYWEWDTGAKIVQYAQQTARNIYHEAAEEPDSATRKELASHAKASESNCRISAMIAQAQALKGVPVTPKELDRNPWLLNCQNGTIDLRTGELKPHSIKDLITMCLEVEYHPEAISPIWLRFLDRVMAGDVELIRYLQKLTGYALTGITKAQMFAFFYGLGQNGKSTFTNTIRDLLEPYAARVESDVIMQQQNKGTPGHNEGLANLIGKRLVISSETDDGRKLAVNLVKDLTGGESIKASRKYEHEVEFEPTFKLWLFGNHKPVITDTTLSIWRRVKLVPWSVIIPDDERDDELSLKLRDEYPGILAWAVRGCLDWQQTGLNEPEVVAQATATYRHDSDILGDFIEDKCTIEFLAETPKSELMDAYKAWCEETKTEPVTQRTFRTHLIEKGIREDKGTGGVRIWKGIKTKENHPPEANSGRSGNSGTFSQELTIRETNRKILGNDDSSATPCVNNGKSCHYPDGPCPVCKSEEWGQCENGVYYCTNCGRDAE